MVQVHSERKTMKFCALCRCKNHDDMPGRGPKNWMCPLLGKMICEVDCHIELAGGMGAQDTLRQVCRMTKKTAREVHEACVKCRHGGKRIEKPPVLISIRTKDDKVVSRGPEFQKAKRESLREWDAQLRKLIGK